MNIQKVAFYTFIIIALFYLVSTLLEFDTAVFYLKPLLLLSLMPVALYSSNIHKKILFTALLFCWIGDVLLLFAEKDEMFFISGLIAFLIGHISYILLFNKMIGTHHGKLSLKPVILVVILCYLSVFYFVVGPHLGGMMIPVMIYAVVISSMLYVAISLSDFLPSPNSFLLVCGAICFVISDSILAINKFYSPLPLSGFLIMFTYIIAQGAIVCACSRNMKSEKTSQLLTGI